MLATKWIGVMCTATLVASTVLTACESKEPTPPTSAGSSAQSTSGLPVEFVLASMPSNVRSVAEAKDVVKAGDEVAVRGRIGGSSEPFVDGRAAFTIVDKSLKACSDIPGDMCTQPWDYCCETKESMARHTATITVLGANGKPMAMTMNGVEGLKELSDVVIVGKVAQVEGNILHINATGIFIAAR